MVGNVWSCILPGNIFGLRGSCRCTQSWKSSGSHWQKTMQPNHVIKAMLSLHYLITFECAYYKTTYLLNSCFCKSGDIWGVHKWNTVTKQIIREECKCTSWYIVSQSHREENVVSATHVDSPKRWKCGTFTKGMKLWVSSGDRLWYAVFIQSQKRH